MEVSRDGKTITLSITFDERTAEWEAASNALNEKITQQQQSQQQQQQGNGYGGWPFGW